MALICLVNLVVIIVIVVIVINVILLFGFRCWAFLTLMGFLEIKPSLSESADEKADDESENDCT